MNPAPDRAAAAVLTELTRRGRTLATAESLTAGLLCATLTEVPGASAVIRGGLIVYATDLKATLAGVDRDLLDRHGAVHPEVAAQLASGAAHACDADYGLGLTGVAGPDPQDGVSPGTVYVGLATPERTTSRKHQLAGDRQAIRAGAVTVALTQLAEVLTVPLGE